MSTRTAYTVVGAVVGAVVGYYTGNVALGIQVGTAIGGLVGNEVDPVKLYGPRLGDAKLQACRDGVPIPWGMGRFRVTGTVIACQPGPPTETEAESQEGKGSGPVNVNYVYTRTHAILICEGPILGIRRIWRDNKLVYDTTEAPTESPDLTGDALTDAINAWIFLRAEATKFASHIRLYNGDETQMPDSALEAIFGAGNVSAHRGTAYMVVVDDDVTNRGGSIPQYDFEVITAGDTEVFPTVNGNSQWVPASGSSYLSYQDNFAKVQTGAIPPTWANVRTNAPRDDALRYFEVEINDYGNGSVIGVVTIDQDMTVDASPSTSHFGHCWGASGTNVLWTTDPGGAGTFPGGDGNAAVRGVAINLETGQMWFSWNGVWSGDPVAGTGESFDTVDGTVYPAIWITAPHEATLRLRADEFTYPIPAGFQEWGATGGIPLPDAPVFSVDDEGNLIYDGSGAVPDSLIPYEPTIKDCLDKIARRTGATPDMWDFTALSSEVTKGFFVAREAQGDGVSLAIGQAYLFDFGEWDGKIRAVPRGANSILTIDIDDLAFREGSPVGEMREQEIERVRKLNVIYADPVMNYIPTKQTAERLSTTISAVGERSIELNVIMGRDQAAQIADKVIKVIWTDLLGTVTFDLPDAFSYLTVTDVIILSYRGKNQRLRIDAIAYDVGRMSVSCRQDRQSCYTSDVEGIGKPPELPATGLLGVTKFVLINTYPLRDQDDKFGFYVAVTGVMQGWPGAIIQTSIDDGATWSDVGIILGKSIIGNLVDPLPYARPEYRDYANTLRVSLGDRTVSSITELQLLQEQNAAAIVSSDGAVEIVQFQDALAEGDGVFALTTLTRGRNGSPATAHFSEETFVMLSDAVFIETPTSLLGKQIKVRAVTRGTPSANNQVYDIDFTTAYIQTEHAPAWLTSYRVGTSISLYWSGSGLLGTAANSFYGTKFAGYRVTFSDGVTSVEKTMLGQSYIYSGAEQTIDFGAPVAVGDLEVEIRQLNSITGAGPAITGIV